MQAQPNHYSSSRSALSNCGVAGLELWTSVTSSPAKGMLPLKPAENHLHKGEFQYRKLLRCNRQFDGDLTVPECCYGLFVVSRYTISSSPKPTFRCTVSYLSRQMQAQPNHYSSSRSVLFNLRIPLTLNASYRLKIRARPFSLCRPVRFRLEYIISSK
jgi:hypothetical protein